MSEPLPPLLTVQTDIARQSTQQAGFAAVLQALTALTTRVSSLTDKVNILMTEDATVAAEVAQIEADTAATLTAIRSVQALFTQLQAEVAAGNLSQTTLDALTKAQQDVAALSTEAQADAAADAPPSGA
jgi:chromosome segregation ATPase